MVNNLKKIRNRLGLTQIQAAQAMGTTKNQLIKLEKGERRLSDVWIDRAARAYGVDPGELVSEKMEGMIASLDNQVVSGFNGSLGRDETIAMLQGVLSAFLHGESKVSAAAETILTIAENQPSGSQDTDRINNIRTSALVAIRLFLPSE